MTTFRFNFTHEDVGQNENVKDTETDVTWQKCEQVLLEKQIKHLDDIVRHAKIFTCRDVDIGHVISDEALLNIREVPNDLKTATHLAEDDHSDLVTGKYEGGLKIWECTKDLLEYIIDNKEAIKLENKNVMDLGCGAGILGIYAFMNGSHVTFQDYNKEVLEYVTIPNVLLNIENEEDRDSEIEKCKFYSGDWASFNVTLRESEQYDLILTSETIYNERNYEKLIEFFLKRLSLLGVAYVAAKIYYFGVGGGTRQFESSIKKNGQLNSEICWKSSGGIQREIIKITRKS